MSETIHDALVLVDVDGTTSNTAQHMQGLNNRLIEAFPAIGEAMPQILAGRRDFREAYGHLSFAQQDEIWQQEHRGTTSHSQLDIYKTFAPEVFDGATIADVRDWLSDTGNFGYAEYPDALLMFEGLRKIGAPAVLFTLGQDKTPDGLPGWQTLKLAAAPSLKGLPRHVSETLPPGGKGQVINESYDTDSGLFRFPRTDGGEPLIARGAVIVDDSIHNLEVVEPALGILIDRKSEMSTWPHPSNIHIVRSLVEVPKMVAQYMRDQHAPN